MASAEEAPALDPAGQADQKQQSQPEQPVQDGEEQLTSNGGSTEDKPAADDGNAESESPTTDPEEGPKPNGKVLPKPPGD